MEIDLMVCDCFQLPSLIMRRPRDYVAFWSVPYIDSATSSNVYTVSV